MGLWELVTGKRILDFPDVQTGFLSFSPSGRLLVTGAVAREGIRLLDVATGRQVFHWPAPAHFHEDFQYIHSLAISPKGRTLATGLQDTTVVLWDLTPAIQRLPPLSSDLEPDELARLWTDLAGEDAAKAHRAIWILAGAAPKTIPFFLANLKPAQPLDLKRVKTLIADLESNEFAVRETASKELKKLAYPAEAVLQKTVKSHPSFEVRRRIEAILALPAEVSSQEELRALRAIQVLEHIGMPVAEKVLKTLSQGALEARLTQEAKASLDRLAHRSAVSP